MIITNLKWVLFLLQFNVETIIEAGDPKEAMCEAVEKLKVELLVLGSHSQGALQRLFTVLQETVVAAKYGAISKITSTVSTSLFFLILSWCKTSIWILI